MNDLPDVAAAWWRGRKDDAGDDSAAERRGGLRDDRAAVAQLRRVATPLDALTIPATHVLARQLEGLRPGWPRRNPETLALLAAVLAEVAAEDARSLPRRCGAGDPPRLAPARFQQLLRARDFGERLMTLRRALAITDRAAAVRPLAASLICWTDRTRQDWTFDYFAAPAPTDTEDTPA